MAEQPDEPLIVVYWEWAEGPHKGARFWGLHNAPQADGRLREWPLTGLRALGAAYCPRPVIGEGLELISAPEAT